MYIVACLNPVGSQPGHPFYNPNQTYENDPIVEFTSANCTPDPPNTNGATYDIVNNQCILASAYGTGGAYPDLQSCETAKNNMQGAPCNGECVPVAEITALNQAIADLQARYCP
jgi:hypothetical protein